MQKKTRFTLLILAVVMLSAVFLCAAAFAQGGGGGGGNGAGHGVGRGCNITSGLLITAALPLFFFRRKG